MYVEPPEDGSDVEVRVDPASNRLQVLEPWEAWDGNDFEDIPILVKTEGKTTTDSISPAGPWLRFRGAPEQPQRQHVPGGQQRLHRGHRHGQEPTLGRGDHARFRRSPAPTRPENLRWVAIGDENYGEGSSREHAALSPRMLGRGGHHRPQFRAHPRVEPEEAGPVAPDLRGTRRDWDRVLEGRPHEPAWG